MLNIVGDKKQAQNICIYILTGEFASLFDDLCRREHHRDTAGDAVGHAKHCRQQENHELADDFRVKRMLDEHDQ